MTNTAYDSALEAVQFIKDRLGNRKPRIGMILGSGLGGIAAAITDAVEIPYGEIPNFANTGVQGHAGKLMLGQCAGVDVAVMRGRWHYYEGYSMLQVTLPIRVFALLGIRSLLVTNAAGGISPSLSPGSLMLITDHLNLMGDSPLRGANDERFGPRFPDMTEVYSRTYIDSARRHARDLGLTLEEGVYGALSGPAYETPAEIRMLATLGADAVGMSTVPEAMVARHSGMRVLAFSCITNVAAGLSREEIAHSDVIKIGEAAGKRLEQLIVRVLPELMVE